VGPSTVRGAGAPGVVHAAQEALARTDLARFGEVATFEEFLWELNHLTRRVRHNLPPPANKWGTGRKVSNIYLRQALYSTYLSRRYRLSLLEPWLELPLDSYTAKALLREPAGADLPPWPGVAKLHWRSSGEYQAAAQVVAKQRGIARVHLDMFWWRALGDS
jgi:hypothetical protein